MTSVLPDPRHPHIDVPPASAAREEAGVARHGALLTVSAAVVAGVSYGCSVLMAHVLDDRHFTIFVAGQTILGVVGVVSLALVPLPLAAGIRAGNERRDALAFAVLVSLILGLVAAAAAGAAAALFASTAVAVSVGIGAFALSLVAPVWGWLQGELRFAAYAGSTVVEVGVRLIACVAAALLGWGAGGVLAGFSVGAVAVLATHLPRMRHDLVWCPAVLRDRCRWTETGGIAATQLVISVLVSADVVLSARWGAGGAAGYAALATLAKGPIYVATGTVLVTFPVLRAGTRGREQVLREALRSSGRPAVLAAVVVATAPPALLGLVLPARHVASAALLPWIATAALGHAVLTVLAVVLLAVRAHRRSLLGLVVATVAVLTGLTGGWQLDGAHGLAVGAASGAAVAVAVLVVLARPVLPPGTGRAAVRTAGGALAVAVALTLVRPLPAVWAVAVAALVALVLRPSARRRTARPAPATSGRLQLLHLGFEDPAMPGAGGGSRRTHEINRRIATEHSVTVLVQRFPGYRDRIQDGVRYMHVGLGSGRTRLSRLLGYVVCLPRVVGRTPADLVIEDFFAPFSTMAAPRWTGRPTVGVVQWLNAAEKSRQYRVPMAWIERFGVRSHRRLIAVSGGVERRLLEQNPDLVVDVIGNGVDPVASPAAPSARADVLFIGRLETAQRGLDLLLEAWARTRGNLDALLVVAGDGPDGERMRQHAAALDIDDSVRFVGWLDDATRFEYLAAARLVVVPSRFETFGMVALEAFAVGTPVVAFDIPCLREIVPDECGRLVPAFDVAGFATAVVEAYHDDRWLAAASGHARRFAARHDWDNLAARQLAVYVAAARPVTVPAPRRPEQHADVQGG